MASSHNPGSEPLPSLRQVADRLLILTQTLRREHGLPEELADELHAASMCCTHVYATLECALDALDFFRHQLDSGLERLRRECPRVPRHEELDRLRPDAQGRYAWDRWQVQAIEAGLDPDLAGLGRAVMREAVQHDWNAHLKAECGWLDAGQAMLARALADGPAASERWDYLLHTAGGRGRWTADGEWQPFL
jgi:hypothetical protein